MARLVWPQMEGLVVMLTAGEVVAVVVGLLRMVELLAPVDVVVRQ